MSARAKARKAIGLLRRPRFVRAAIVNKVAAAVEHLAAIRFAKAATLIDVGANKGQFSLAFRALRPNAPIHAFEPLPDAARRFEAMFRSDPLTKLYKSALSDEESEVDFHVTDRSDSSSLLRPGPGEQAAFGVGEESMMRVVATRLDTVLDLARLARPILMKIDVQGAELQVLRGCVDLEPVDFIYVELSFIELYDNQPLFGEVAAYLAGRGYRLAGVFNQVETAAFGPTQADFLFTRIADAGTGA